MSNSYFKRVNARLSFPPFILGLLFLYSSDIFPSSNFFLSEFYLQVEVTKYSIKKAQGIGNKTLILLILGTNGGLNI